MKYPNYYRIELFSGKLSKFYDIFFSITTLGLEDKARKKITGFISKGDKKILDLATGTGSSAITIKNKFKNTDVYGIDLSEEMLNIAGKKNKKIKFSLQNIEKTDFKRDYFDVVTISFGLHEVPLKNRYNVMKEAYRLLKKKGKFIIFEFSMPKNIILKVLFSIFLKIVEPYGKSFIKRDLIKDLKKYKFKDVRKIYYYNNIFQIIYSVK